MKGVKGYQYILSIFLFPLGVLFFLLILNGVMWGSYQLINNMTNDPKSAGIIAVVLTATVAILSLVLLILLASKKSGSSLGTLYWFPLLGILFYHLTSTLLWWFVYGLREHAWGISAGPAVLLGSSDSAINIIGLDLMALIITFFLGIVTVLIVAIRDRWRQSS